mgnify:CR=1 FL=1
MNCSFYWLSFQYVHCLKHKGQPSAPSTRIHPRIPSNIYQNWQQCKGGGVRAYNFIGENVKFKRCTDVECLQSELEHVWLEGLKLLKTKWMLLLTQQMSLVHSLQDFPTDIRCSGVSLERVTKYKLLRVIKVKTRSHSFIYFIFFFDVV